MAEGRQVGGKLVASDFLRLSDLEANTQNIWETLVWPGGSPWEFSPHADGDTNSRKLWVKRETAICQQPPG